ncbi:MAG TPA: TIM barrel protein [Candidatus Peribacteraceae bacterium]|nr:TIM barrel protein [Candidatus Peribacteraceae bacterium]
MLRIATPGVPLSTPKPGGTLKGIEHAHKLGITAMEMEWVQRVPLNAEHMQKIREASESFDVALTVHAPYFINLNAQDKEKLAASKKRILDALSMAEIAGAVSVCVHPAFYQGMDPAKAFDNVRRATVDIMKKKDKLFPHVNLGFETMGKPTQFGTLEEVLTLSKEFGIYPCVDPAHMHARSNGKINTAKEWNEMLDLYAEYLGKTSLAHMHLHFSGINYGPKGEKNHLPIRESDANWKDFLKVLKKRRVGGILVSESPLLEEDALFLQKKYEKA